MRIFILILAFEGLNNTRDGKGIIFFKSLIIHCLALKFCTRYCSCEYTVLPGALENSRELKQRGRQKSNRFRLAEQQLCTCFTDFLYISLPSLHDYSVKVPNFTFCRGREHKQLPFPFPQL